MTDYQGNSHKAKEGGKPTEEKKIERITSSEVHIQKKGPWRSFKSLIIEADMSSVGRFVWLDILVPMVKNMLVATAEQGANRLVFGDRRPMYRPPSSAMGIGSSSHPRGVTNYVPYSSMSMGRRTDPRAAAQLPTSRSTAADARGYLITARSEAEEVLETMAHVIDRYDVVTVADLHEMLGHPVTSIDHRWGWNDLRSAQIKSVSEGWILEVPQPQEINA